MGPVLVVVGHEHLKNTLEVPLVQNQASNRGIPNGLYRTNRTATPLACGVRTATISIRRLETRRQIGP